MGTLAHNRRRQMKEMKFASACKDFFGLKQGDTLKEFAAELKSLTEKDRAEIKAELEKNGYKIIAD